VVLRPAAFRAASRGRPPRTGTTISYRDSRAAITTVVVLRARPGVVRGGVCVAATRAGAADHAKGCTRYVAVGSFRHADRAGANSFWFPGRIGTRPLAVGTYRLRLTPALGGVVGRPLTASFRVIR
jgi:hypothetical protein